MGMITEEMQSFVNEQRLGFIATGCPIRTPNLSPKGTTLVWDADHLVFADICSPTTIENRSFLTELASMSPDVPKDRSTPNNGEDERTIEI